MMTVSQATKPYWNYLGPYMTGLSADARDLHRLVRALCWLRSSAVRCMSCDFSNPVSWQIQHRATMRRRGATLSSLPQQVRKSRSRSRWFPCTIAPRVVPQLKMLKDRSMSSKWIWLLVAVARSAAGCPEGFRSFNEKCYIFTEEKGSMTQCQDRICSGLGATLAVIHDIDTQFSLVNLTQEFQGPAYVGLFERGVNESGDWTWVDGSNFSFEPDANGSQYPLARMGPLRA